MEERNNYYEEREKKFDARLRYVENLISAYNIFVQAESERKAGNINYQGLKEWKKQLYALYLLLSIHDDEIKEPDLENVSEDYIRKIILHPEIKEITQNNIKVRDWKTEVEEDY